MYLWIISSFDFTAILNILSAFYRGLRVACVSSVVREFERIYQNKVHLLCVPLSCFYSLFRNGNCATL